MLFGAKLKPNASCSCHEHALNNLAITIFGCSVIQIMHTLVYKLCLWLKKKTGISQTSQRISFSFPAFHVFDNLWKLGSARLLLEESATSADSILEGCRTVAMKGKSCQCGFQMFSSLPALHVYSSYFLHDLLLFIEFCTVTCHLSASYGHWWLMTPLLTDFQNPICAIISIFLCLEHTRDLSMLNCRPWRMHSA